jgi:hypothetical protein
MKHAPLTIPAFSNQDRLPDDRAVWRDPPCPPEAPGFLSVTVEYAGGMKERTTVAKAMWLCAVRWRWGWAPQPAANPFEGLGLAAKE